MADEVQIREDTLVQLFKDVREVYPVLTAGLPTKCSVHGCSEKAMHYLLTVVPYVSRPVPLLLFVCLEHYNLVNRVVREPSLKTLN